jgi:3-isopropylmalate dehydratase small subunit
LSPDDGAEYDDRIEIDLGELGPLVAKPHNPDNVVPVEEVAGTPIAQVCIGSSVNSGYNDLALPGAVLADRGGRIVHPSIAATATPGSRQILAAIAESGVYRQLSDGGVRMLEPVCGPCVGMGQAPPSDSNSLRTFNRNFPGRSGTPEDSVFLCSPAVAAATLLTGRIEDPRQYGEPPELLPMPELRPYVVDVHIFAPAGADEAERIEIPRGPNIKRPPEHTPLGDSLEACVATVQPDDISTGDLAPDGVEVMAYRSNVPAIAEFTLRHRDPEFRKRLKEWGSGFIVAGDNYGQGSSREHAALAPLHLGVKAAIAKSFARIHRRNLIAQGIVALTFSEPSDYDKAEVWQRWCLASLREELESGSESITARIEDSGEELTLANDFSAREREILVAGGLLSYLRDGTSASNGRDSESRSYIERFSQSHQWRGATNSAWVARPTRPPSSYSTLSVTPVPPAAIRVCDSRQIHSPTGSRSTYTVRSALMNTNSSRGSVPLRPAPKSLAAARR